MERAHCRDHGTYDDDCADCRFALMVQRDGTEVVFPRGVPTRVPRGQCRCPVLDVGDFCPVHGG